MKIRVGILEKDICYLNRVVTAFEMKYSDKLELYSFSEKEAMLDSLESNKIDVLLVNEEFEIDAAKLPDRCGLAYLVETNDIEMLREQRAICKFQKADMIYKQILSIYSENAANISGVKFWESACRTAAFVSIAGGTGTSTLAAAAALREARQGRRTIYINLEQFCSTDCFFAVSGQFDMSDIIYALKSKKANISLKIESCIQKDDSGVFFFAPPKTALDMQELNHEDVMLLLSNLTLSGNYDLIIVDMNFGLDQMTMEILNGMDVIVMTSDGTEISNRKVSDAYRSLENMERNSEYRLLNKLQLIYSRFSNKTGAVLENIDVNTVGGIPKYENATTKQILAQISNMEMLDKIVR